MNLALLLLRVVAGIAFILHGWPKMRDPLAWMGTSMPPALQALAAVAELGGGICWVAGVFPRIASAGIACTMVVAIARHVLVKRDPFIGGWELAAVYLAIAVLLFVAGPGAYSLHRAMR
jgi:putative oxidoreductase